MVTGPIDRVTLVEVALPFRRPFSMAKATVEERVLILVGLTRNGVTGWGEAAPFPGHTGDDIRSAWTALVTTSEELVGGWQPPRAPITAGAALGQAWRDLEAREEGIPLFETIGGKAEPIPASVAVGIPDSLDSFGEVLGEVVAAGYRRVKLKVRPGWDEEPLRFVRDVFPMLDAGVDANESYDDVDDPAFAMFAELGASYVEQPLAADRLADLAVLRSDYDFALCLDESIGSVDDAERALDAGAADIICVKPGRIGVTASVDVHDLAADRGVAVKATGLLESGVGRAHTVAVGTLPGCTFHDLCTSTWYFTRDVIRPGWRLENGMILPPERPGIGVEVDADAVDSVTIRRRNVG